MKICRFRRADGSSGLGLVESGAVADVSAVLDELLRIGAVRTCDDGLIEPVARGYVPQRSASDKLRMLGTDVADLIDTIDHNIEHGADEPRFQRKVMYEGIPVEALPAFRRWSATFSQALLEKLDRWLAARDAAEPQADAAGAGAVARVGVGIYYFEGPPGVPGKDER